MTPLEQIKNGFTSGCDCDHCKAILTIIDEAFVAGQKSREDELTKEGRGIIKTIDFFDVKRERQEAVKSFADEVETKSVRIDNCVGADWVTRTITEKDWLALRKRHGV